MPTLVTVQTDDQGNESKHLSVSVRLGSLLRRLWLALRHGKASLRLGAAPSPYNVASGNNANATLTFNSSGLRLLLNGTVYFSYSGTPTGGRLTITDGGTTVLDVDVTSGGPGPLAVKFLSSAVGNSVVLTLYAGGSGVTGKLTYIPN